MYLHTYSVPYLKRGFSLPKPWRAHSTKYCNNRNASSCSSLRLTCMYNTFARIRTVEANCHRDGLPLQLYEANERVTHTVKSHQPTIIKKRKKNHATYLMRRMTTMTKTRRSHRPLVQVQPGFNNQHPQIHMRLRVVLHIGWGLLLRLN